jgi:hypothetical protein
MKLTNVERNYISKKLAAHFNEDTEYSRVCACSGFECGDLGCAIWWGMFLDRDKEDITKMLDIYFMAIEIAERKGC